MSEDLQSLYAQEIFGVPDGWRWCSVKTLGSSRQIAEGKATHFEMKGAVPGFYTRGPRKGRPKWPGDKDLDVFIVNFKEFREWVAQRRKSSEVESLPDSMDTLQ